MTKRLTRHQRRELARHHVVRAVLRGVRPTAPEVRVHVQDITRRRWTLGQVRRALLDALSCGELRREQTVRAQWSAADVWSVVDVWGPR